MKNKVFCIGFHKTGTTSLGQALEMLGYRVSSPQGKSGPEIEEKVLSMAFDIVEKFDAFEDNPWPVIYREMDSKFPNSKFILMLRDSESWIRSQVNHFGRNDSHMRKWIYGVGHPEGNEDIYIERFERHNKEVLEYFQDRPQDLLVMNLKNGDGWNELCFFLNAEPPDVPFPHANRAAERGKNVSLRTRVKKRVKNLVRRMAR